MRNFEVPTWLIGEDSEQVFHPGTVFFRQGETPRSAVFVCDGEIETFHTEPNGNQASLLRLSSPAIPGLASLILKTPYDCTAVSLTACLIRPCSLVKLRQCFLDPEICDKFFCMLARDIISLQEQLSALACVPAGQRLDRYLQQLAELSSRTFVNNASVQIRLPFTEQRIARFLGITPVHLSRLLNQAERAGSLRRSKTGITLLAPLYGAPSKKISALGQPHSPDNVHSP
jgi:CRP-like cAMP-binding protein